MTAFKRSLAMMSAISAALSSGLLINQLIGRSEFQYKSRGHGKGFIGKNYFNRSSNKYKPHQGKKEIARRAKQLKLGVIKAY